MQRFYTDRETYGPEFDNRLIRLVRQNPAIYDVNHHHYRRNPVRVAIWERIATELEAPSKFLQTKWKNIRYNYLQEIKCMETGHVNTNIRKRRFTEDLSFLQSTAQLYNVKKATGVGAGIAKFKNSVYNSSDNDSNSYMYPDQPEPSTHAFEVIEIEHSDDDDDDAMQVIDFETNNCSTSNHANHDTTEECDGNADNVDDTELKKVIAVETGLKTPAIIDDLKPDVTTEQPFTPKLHKALTTDLNSMGMQVHKTTVTVRVPQSCPSSPLSPLLTPLVVMDNGDGDDANDSIQDIGETTNGKAIIDPIPKPALRHQKSQHIPPFDIMANAAKRKAMQVPFPVLTPINDPIELYCLSLVDSLRNMPRSERERVKYEFAKILKDAKYNDQS